MAGNARRWKMCPANEAGEHCAFWSDGCGKSTLDQDDTRECYRCARGIVDGDSGPGTGMFLSEEFAGIVSPTLAAAQDATGRMLYERILQQHADFSA